MTKIEKWIEENKPQTSDDIYDVRFTILEDEVKAWELGAKMTAKYILEECGVLEALEDLVLYFNDRPSPDSDWEIDQKVLEKGVKALNKIKGEKKD